MKVEVIGFDTAKQAFPVVRELSKKDFLVFYQAINHTTFEDLPDLVALPKVRERFVIISVGDRPFAPVSRVLAGLATRFPKLKRAPIINLTGARSNDKTIAGYGFVPLIHDLNVFGDVPFEKRASEFRFVGALRADRERFLGKFRKCASTSFTLQKDFRYIPTDGSFEEVEDFPNEFLDDLGYMEWGDYLLDMGKHKYSLVPLGFGHTFRFLESMAAGSLVISDDISHLRFNREYFVEGHNYLSVGKKLENVERIVRLCQKDPQQVQSIAQRGREIYVRHFLLSEGELRSVPKSTLWPILERLNQAFDETLFRDYVPL